MNFEYNIIKKLAILDEWKNVDIEANIISYGKNGAPKLDIRKWDISQNKMMKGIALSKEEAQRLKDCLDSLDFSIFGDDTEKKSNDDESMIIKIKNKALDENLR